MDNHRRQQDSYTAFCEHYGYRPVNPSTSTLAYYITHLANKFTSAASVRNYVSGVAFMHKQLGVEAPAITSFPVTTLLRAVDLTLRTPPQRKQPIYPALLHKLCRLCDMIGTFGVAMKVAITFGFYGMLRQSNLAPRQAADFDRLRHTCRGDVIHSPPGLVVVVKWAKAQQTMDNIPLVPLPTVHGSPTDPVAAFDALQRVQPALHQDQPLLSIPSSKGYTVVTSAQLATCLAELLRSLQLDPTNFSLHSLRRGGATTAYRAGADQLAVKRHGQWRSDAFWVYITSPLVAQSSVARALAASAHH